MPTRSEIGAGRALRADELDRALARAVVWRFLSLGFAPPSRELRRALTDEPQCRALGAALSRLGLQPCQFEDSTRLEVAFGSIFGHNLRGRVCPYETEYGSGQVFQQAQELADLQGWYAAFGLERRSDSAERADHIGVECEFVGFLALKEAYFSEKGDHEQLERVRDAYRSFLRDHLGRFGVTVAARLRECDDGFYGRLASLLRDFLTSECRRLGVEAAPNALPLRPELPDPPAACGVDGECGSCPAEESGPPRSQLLQLGRKG